MTFNVSDVDSGSPGHPETPPASGPPECCIIVNSISAELSVETLHPVPVQDGGRKYRIYGDIVSKAEKRCIPQKFERVPWIPGPQGPVWECHKFVVPLNCEGGKWPERKKPGSITPAHFGPKDQPDEVDFGYDFECNHPAGPFPERPPRLHICSVEWESCGDPCDADPTDCDCNETSSVHVDFEIEFLNIIGDFTNLFKAVRSLVGLGSTANDVSDFANDIGGCAARFFSKFKDAPEMKGAFGRKYNCQCKPTGKARSPGKPDKKPKFDPAGDLPSWTGLGSSAGSSGDPCDCAMRGF